MFKQSWEEWYALFLFHCDMYEGVQPEIAFQPLFMPTYIQFFDLLPAPNDWFYESLGQRL